MGSEDEGGLDKRSRHQRFNSLLMTAVRSFAVLDGLRAVDLYWRAVPAFRYTESDDWRLVGEDLWHAMISPMARDPLVLDAMKTRFKDRLQHLDLDDDHEARGLATLAEAIVAAERHDLDSPWTRSHRVEETPPSARGHVRPAGHLTGKA
jgi:hypothetical protein